VSPTTPFPLTGYVVVVLVVVVFARVDAGGDETYGEASGSSEDNEFDMVVGALEDILLGDEFNGVQKGFLDAHCSKFSDAEENKVEYTDLFQEYTALIEKTLDAQLQARIPGFSMKAFEAVLTDRKDQIDIEIFDLLMSLGDFSEFKELMLAHQREKKLQAAGQMGDLLTVFGKRV